MSPQFRSPVSDTRAARYRRILLVAIAADLMMFFVEIVASAFSRLSSLASDTLEFLSDHAKIGQIP